ncbi:hypothetical protein VNO77_22203 [Canavalia gladiata]|uniref:Uncharacterized protein n=1 Tax=Canavalia gladiata TaxID=3824 RepID=A0AAN9L2C3_CANGL
MASFRMLLLSLFIAFSLLSFGHVQASRKLLAPTLPNLGNYPGLNFPPFPKVTEWPEYRMPPPLFGTVPPFTPPATITNP